MSEKRHAHVWKSHPVLARRPGRLWTVQHYPAAWVVNMVKDPELTIEDCPDYAETDHATHGEALRHALAVVGLGPKEDPR